MRKKLFLGLLLIFMSTSILVQAQDVVFMQEETEWSSPFFETSKDTRVEWTAYVYPGAEDPTFEFLVLDENNMQIDKREGLEGMGFMDQQLRVRVNVTAQGIRIWEIRLFYLKAPPLTSQDPTSITTTETPPLTSGESPATITEVVTIAVYTTLPPERVLVTFGYFALGALLVIAVIAAILVGLVTKGIDIFLVRTVQTKEEPDE